VRRFHSERTPRRSTPRGIQWEANVATKAEFMKALEELPEDATIDDALERLAFMIAVEHGLSQADAGDLIPHEEIVKTRLK